MPVERTAEQPADVRTEHIVYGADDVEITLLTDGSKGGSTNPYAAVLEVDNSDDDFVVEGWSITFDGSIIAEGSGTKAVISDGLDYGKYAITWNVTKREVAMASISREFFVS
jgi:hypothetical protein